MAIRRVSPRDDRPTITTCVRHECEPTALEFREEGNADGWIRAAIDSPNVVGVPTTQGNDDDRQAEQ